MAAFSRRPEIRERPIMMGESGICRAQATRRRERVEPIAQGMREN